MPIPPLHPVMSSNVAAVGHDGEALYVKFRGRDGTPGSTYRYPTADQAVMDEMLAAPSVGRYAQTVLRRLHEGELVVQGVDARQQELRPEDTIPPEQPSADETEPEKP